MAKSKEDIKYGAAQAKLSEDEMLRVGYKHGTPIEAGKIADSEPVDLFSSAHKIADAKKTGSTNDQTQLHRSGEDDSELGGMGDGGSGAQDGGALGSGTKNDSNTWKYV